MLGFSSILSQLEGLFGGSDFDPSSPMMWVYVVSLAMVSIFMMYAQKFQSRIILNEISHSLVKLKTMKENARKEAVDYVKNSVRSTTDPSAGVDRLLEYFTIMPVDLDPSGIVRKLEHVMRNRDERMRSEVRKLCNGAGDREISRMENILEASTALNMIYKVVRHFYL